MESIKELKEICQASKRNKPPKFSMAGYLLYRDISIYITKFFLLITNKKINPNFISVLNIILIILGGLTLRHHSFRINILAFILIILSILLDKVDGELARYLKRDTLRGGLLEQVYHFVFMPSILTGLGLKLFFTYQDNIYLFLTLLVVVLIIFNTISSTFIYFMLFFKKIEWVRQYHNQERKITPANRALLKLLKILKFSTIIARNDLMIFMFLLVYVVDFFNSSHFLKWFFIIYITLVVIRFLRIVVTKYLNVDEDAQKIISKLYNSL